MMGMPVVLPLTLALSATGMAQTLITDITVGSTKIGQNTYEARPDGSFASRTEIKVTGVVIASSLTGRFDRERLVEVTLEESSGSEQGKLVWKNDQLTVYRNGKPVVTNQKAEVKQRAFFANYHPQMLRTLFDEWRRNPAATELTALNLNSFQPLKFPIKVSQPTVTVASKPLPIVRIDTQVGGTELLLAFDPQGLPLGMKVPSQAATFLLQGYDGVFVDPLSLYPELSAPTYAVETQRRVRVTMPDSVRLMADILLPKGEGKFPTILIRTPYGRAASALLGDIWAKRGYVVVVQDVRGRGGSDGEFDPFVHEVADGKATLDWIVAQPWSNGKVGMIGGSYLGSVQWAAAVSGHPALKCIVPQVSPPDPTRNVPWENGAFLLLGNIWWCRVVMDRVADMTGVLKPIERLDGLKALPLTKVDDLMLGRSVPFYDRWLARDSERAWSSAYTLQQVARVKIPVLHVSGTWDGDGIGTKLHWEALRQSGGNQWLVFGPWDHFFNTRSKFGDVDFGPQSLLELDSVYLRFFDTFLKDKPVGWEKQPRVRFFITGANRWVEAPDWPLPGSKAVTWYLGGGKANGTKSTGTLSTKPGSGADRYRYDPNRVSFDLSEVDPDPSRASTKVPADQVDQNTLVFRTSRFDRPTTITGPMTATLYVSTTARDATFHVAVADQDPKGELRLVAMPGTTRVTWQGGRFQKLTPNKVYKVEVRPWEFAHQFAKGHRMVLLVASDMFPRYARNPGTGEPDRTATRLVAATHTVYKTASRPSSVTFRMLP
jgi:putative CocE/NonD family hydrolase